MKLFSSLLMSLLLFPAKFCVAAELGPRATQKPRQIETTYDDKKDRTTVRLTPVQISGEKAHYHSVHIAPAFSYPGHQFKKPEIIEFEVRTVVKTRLKIDLYVVFVVDGETIFLSSSRWAVKRPVPGKRWIGERLVFRMPYATFMKITKARAAEIKMDGVVFPLTDLALEQLRVFARRLEVKSIDSGASRNAGPGRLTRRPSACAIVAPSAPAPSQSHSSSN